MLNSQQKLIDRFAAAVASLRIHPDRLEDENVEAELRGWLHGNDEPLPWSGSEITPDEWFFVTTLYGQETRDQQRRHIRRYFPEFMNLSSGDIRLLTRDMLEPWTLRSDWMKGRLCRMAKILRDRGLSMAGYVEHLRKLERTASPRNPMPALDEIVRDHRASEWKTLSIFVRDCVRGNCFPIDSRVKKELLSHALPVDERLLVSVSLFLGKNPRQIARMFYEAGGEKGDFSPKGLTAIA